jgi:hypothetical protein
MFREVWHQLPHNGPIDEEPTFVSLDNGVTNRGFVLVNNLGGLTERELGGAVTAVGRVPESATRESQIPTPVVPVDWGSICGRVWYSDPNLRKPVGENRLDGRQMQYDCVWKVRTCVRNSSVTSCQHSRAETAGSKAYSLPGWFR